MCAHNIFAYLHLSSSKMVVIFFSIITFSSWKQREKFLSAWRKVHPGDVKVIICVIKFHLIFYFVLPLSRSKQATITAMRTKTNQDQARLYVFNVQSFLFFVREKYIFSKCQINISAEPKLKLWFSRHSLITFTIIRFHRCNWHVIRRLRPSIFAKYFMSLTAELLVLALFPTTNSAVGEVAL